ncbi:hypothetical protein B0H66DRAFT_525934 [Apodospora peruviana]|uniref:Uncharacterized protein n=1 Tax=Apodospora peruviana TaxID=516989 RepID=A0AAE0LXW0_9PEZI|nr:hypothetical protein B0H66DRAFT_525934 [Apodospora peruviana]
MPPPANLPRANGPAVYGPPIKDIRVAAFRKRFGFFFLFPYIVFIILIWVLSCYQARKPFLLVRLCVPKQFQSYDVDLHGIMPAHAKDATNLTYALDALNVFAALVALPITYAILARAAVVRSLRTDKNKQLNVKQLFALADRKFLVGTDGSLYDTQYTPNTWDARLVAISPELSALAGVRAREVITSVRHSLIGSRPSSWKATAWYDAGTKSYFASTVPRDTVTGMIRHLALRMDSQVECKRTESYEYPSPCPGREFPFRHPRLKFDVCVTANFGTQEYYTNTPWRESYLGSTWMEDMQSIGEEMHVRYIDEDGLDVCQDEDWRCGNDRPRWTWDGNYKCSTNTTLANFELGNFYNNQTNGGPIQSVVAYIEATNATGGPPIYEGNINWVPPQSPITSDYAQDWSPTRGNSDDEEFASGPLLITAQALFGNGSFYYLAQQVDYNLTYDKDPYRLMLAASCPYPFQHFAESTSPKSCIEYADLSDTGTVDWTNAMVFELMRELFIDHSEERSGDYEYHARTSRSYPLDVAFYLSNRAVMDGAVDGLWSQQSVNIFHHEGIEVRQYDLSNAALIVNSVWLGLQVLGILGFVYYAYRVPTWTSTLDALAIARITHQLKDDNLLRGLGLRRVKNRELKKLKEVDALVGVDKPREEIERENLSGTNTAAASATTTPPRDGSGTSLGPAALNNNRSSTQSGHGQLTDADRDGEMGMNSIPIPMVDLHTVLSEHTATNVNDNHSTNNNLNTNNLYNNDNTHTNNNNNELPSPLHPRIPLDAGDIDNHTEPDGRISPPPYTPRTGPPGPDLPLPPSYSIALSVNELRVGAEGLVTRKFSQRRKNIWV